MNQLSAEKMLEKAVSNMITDYPFFATLVLRMPIKEAPDKYPCPTACTDGTRILFDRDFIEGLTIEEAFFILMHEVMHCALGHLWRREERDMDLWNVATDLAINAIIKEVIDEVEKNYSTKYANIKPRKISMPKKVLYDKQFIGMSAEEIYSILRKTQKQDEQEQGGQQEENKNGKGDNKPSGGSQNNQNGNGQKQITANGKTYNVPQNHESWKKEDGSSTDHKNQQKVKWDSALLSAYESAKDAGNTPLGLERGLINIKQPQKDWRTLLQEFIQEEYNDYSLMPPDKRIDGDFFMFDFNDTIEVVNDILFFVDTSGSMGETAVNMCFSEIQGAINQFEKHLHGKLFFFDYDVAPEHYDFDEVNGNIAGLHAFGGGGTSFRCVFRYIKENRENFDNINGVIILTDGYCDYPDVSETDGIPVLWIYTTTEGEHEAPPFGRSAILDESLFI